jgi:transcriptional regulator NrdR family protein
MKNGQVPCPFCGHGFSRTLNTQKTRRRRECTRCKRRFTTYEIPAAHQFRCRDEYEKEVHHGQIRT